MVLYVKLRMANTNLHWPHVTSLLWPACNLVGHIVPFCIEPACGSYDTEVFDTAVYIPMLDSCCELLINIDPDRVTVQSCLTHVIC
jgi:hypothetical protein